MTTETTPCACAATDQHAKTTITPLRRGSQGFDVLPTDTSASTSQPSSTEVPHASGTTDRHNDQGPASSAFSAEPAPVADDTEELLSHLNTSNESMKMNAFQTEVVRTLKISGDHERDLLVVALGLNGEAGEAGDLVKKVIGHGHGWDDTVLLKLLYEVGDTLYYVAALAHLLGFNLGEVAQANVTKLRARYPDGFSTEKSKFRGSESR